MLRKTHKPITKSGSVFRFPSHSNFAEQYILLNLRAKESCISKKCDYFRSQMSLSFMKKAL